MGSCFGKESNKYSAPATNTNNDIRPGISILPIAFRLNSSDVSYPVVSFTVFLTRVELQNAVNLWCSNRSEAEAQWGHISQWDVSHVTDTSDLFKDQVDFNDDISEWDVSNVTNMSNMFSGAVQFDLSLSKWKLFNQFKKKKKTKCSTVRLLLDCYFSIYQAIPVELRTIIHDYIQCPIDNENIREAVQYWISDPEQCFWYCGHISSWHTGRVTDMSRLFEGEKDFNEMINNWDVSNVTDMSKMFSGAASFNQPLDHWDVENVRTMFCMFHSASSFNQPLDTWQVQNVTTMRGMFHEAKSFNQPLEKWDVRNVTNMGNMFYGATEFNQPLNNWDISNVEDMRCMFWNARKFKHNQFTMKIPEERGRGKERKSRMKIPGFSWTNNRPSVLNYLYPDTLDTAHQRQDVPDPPLPELLYLHCDK
jgi:surface protein